jgi:hypothetical protein
VSEEKAMTALDSPALPPVAAPPPPAPATAVPSAPAPTPRAAAPDIDPEPASTLQRVLVAARDPFDISSGTLGVAAPATRWMFADGGTDGVLDTFYLAYNPGPNPVEATFTYHTPEGAIARQRTQTLPPGVRTTTWANVDDAPLGRRESWVDVAATAPILLERSWRFDPPGRTVTQQSATPGTNDASSRWFFPEVDGQASYETTIVLANPATREAVLDVNLLFTDREERQAGQVRVPAGGRISLSARAIVPDGRASVEIVSANGVRVLGERTLSGRDAQGAWRLAAIGAREPGARWTLPSASFRDAVVTNVSPFPARVELHFYTSYSYGEDTITTIEIPARSRKVVAVSRGVAQAQGSLDTLRVTSQSTERGTADIVVAGERYSDVGGTTSARASGVIGALLP